MGISDKDYADALEHQRAHQVALMKLELERQNTTLETTIASAGTWANPISHISKTLNEEDLKHEAMTAPLSALVDMWTMRWQGEWVSGTELAEDKFWSLAVVRLTGVNKLEKHNLASQYAPVYRIIE